MTGERDEPALRCNLAASSYFTACMAALSSPSSDEAWRCVFGDGDVTTPSHLDWLTDCVETEVMCE